MKPFLIGISVFSLFALGGWLVVERPLDLMKSLGRVGVVGTSVKEYEIERTPRDQFGEVNQTLEQKIDFGVWGDELQEIVFSTDQQIIISPKEFDLDSIDRQEVTIVAGEDFRWRTSETALLSLGQDFIPHFYVANAGQDTANLTLTVTTAPRFPQVYSVPVTAALVCLIVLIYFVVRTTAPRLSAIALSTYKSEIAQPLFPILVALGCSLIVMFVFIPYNTFGDDIKMMKDTGFSLILFLCLIQLMWAAGTSVSDEIDGRTALTVLSKPIGRRSFLVGKFAGISWVVFLLFAALTAAFIISVAYKPIYDAREMAKTVDDWQPCFREIQLSFPGLVLVLLEVLLLTAVSVAISTRLSLLANFTVCSTIYVLGHLTPTIVQSSLGQFTIVRFFARLIATVVPNLEAFNITAAVAADAIVPVSYMLYALVYCVVYSLIAMLLSFFLFEDRDLA